MSEQHGHHDMGGEPGGPIDRSEHEYVLWEKRVDALLLLLADKNGISCAWTSFARTSKPSARTLTTS